MKVFYSTKRWRQIVFDYLKKSLFVILFCFHNLCSEINDSGTMISRFLKEKWEILS